ncbi:MAG: type II secretion system protein GspL [Pseudomonadota bacterium]
MTTLYIRHPARAEGEHALARFALVADGGAVLQQGEGAIRSLGDLVAASRRVVLLLAAADVTLLHVKAPPLSNARLKAALPALVEEHVLGDPSECVLVAAPSESPDGTRSVAVAQRAWLEPLVKSLLALGARGVAALPFQLCLPLHPGSVAAAIGGGEVTLRHGLYEGLGLALAAPPALALQTVRVLAGDSPLVLTVPQAELGEYQALALEAGPAITLEGEHWEHWIAGSKSTTLDLVPGLGAAGAKVRDWQRWRWPLRVALLALLVNVVGLNLEWLRLKREADALRLSINQTFTKTYPGQPVQQPLAQMRANVAAAKAGQGQAGPSEMLYLTAAFGEAMRNEGGLAVATLDFRAGVLTVKAKPESVTPGVGAKLAAALAPRAILLDEKGPGIWQLSSNPAGVPGVNTLRVPAGSTVITTSGGQQ